ncbi:beta-lactam-binding protein with PASTA domain [Aquimarina sp. EL_43]|uniref:PASTA domain-containing protein n=1 Tax=Aquimarina TaxID=290174 RepID=UPI00046E9F0B|nr:MULTISPECIES: PASTA domain-containing protein [Aquimarina]MBG6130894.1 beta-lactam-binding protein with PASTA domain [Aquimarina sp. EL_35]MBG6151353.1 beta-lactam-binding protein with PASTA domain [Aquimarina sp. EL_32]MBG6169284.1 beta-lactam-binding protein with PASTA domain [Aquimarina sp. EL_43]
MSAFINFFRGLFKFIYSKIFLIQLVIAVAMLAILSYVALEWLESTTNHHQRIVVPSLSKKTLDEVGKILEEKELRYEVQDSANFNPDYPRYSVLEQNPVAGSEVKENRKIYVTLNPSGYRKIEVPNVVQRTRRQAEPKLVALGFKIGSVTYQPNIARDMVLELRHNGKRLKPGTKLMKTSVIDLVLGNGEGGTINLSN